MLVDVEMHPSVPLVVFAVVGANVNPPRLQKGIYTETGYNFRNLVGDQADNDFWSLDIPKDDFIKSFGKHYIAKLQKDGDLWFDEEKNSYSMGAGGVVDTPEQFVNKIAPMLEAHPRKMAVGLTVVLRAEQPFSGGWRWHKWGTYLGTKDPQTEYLHDEPVIDRVCCFSIIALKEEKI